jgi:hypothetical protein
MGIYVNRIAGDHEVEARLSEAVVRRILDDDNDGEADATPLVRLIADAESKFEASCRGKYDLTDLRLARPGEAVRLVLDGVEAFGCKRFPRAFGRDWLPLWTEWNKELDGIRTGKTRLDVEGSPEPHSNVGGVSEGSDPDYPTEIEAPTFLVTWGRF